MNNNFEFNYYKAVLKSDTGKHSIITSSYSEEAASMLIQAAQCCPKSAIISIKKLTDKQAKKLLGR